MSSWVLACQAIRFTHPQVANCFDSRTGKCHFGSGLCFAKGQHGQHGQHVHNLLWFCNIIYADSAATGANHLHFQTPTVLQMQKYILKAANTERCESEQDRHHSRQVMSYLQPLCSSGITASLEFPTKIPISSMPMSLQGSARPGCPRVRLPPLQLQT